MKKKTKKIFSIILVLLLVLGMLIPAFAFGIKADERLVFYVEHSAGSDKNDGKSFAKPLESINRAIELAGDSDFEIIIIDSYELPETILPHKGQMTISGYDSTSKITTKSHGGYSFSGNVTFKDIQLENGLYAWMNFGGNDLVLGKGLKTAGEHQIIAGGKLDETQTDKLNIKVTSGTWSRITLGPMAATTPHTVKNDAKIHVTSGSIGTLFVGGDGWTNEHKGVTFESNVLVRIDGGQVEGIKAGTLRYAPTVKGAFMLICNNSSTTSVDKTLSTAKINGGKYYVYSQDGGYADFVYDTNGKSVKGKISVNLSSGKYATVKTKNGEQKIFESSVVDIPDGTTEISYHDFSDIKGVINVKNDDGDFYYFPSDMVEITANGIISLPDEGMEKDSHIFGGWYFDSDFTKPVTDGEKIGAGRIYARWIPFDPKVISTVGVGIKPPKAAALRYVTKIDTDFRAQLVSLNGANQTLSPENENFNAQDGANYGTIAMPKEILSENPLTVRDSYNFGGKTYRAKCVPALKTLQKGDGFDLFTLRISNIYEKNYNTEYTARPYITYFDASGTKRTVYGDEYTDTLFSVADRAYRSGTEKDTVLKTIYDTILVKGETMSNPLANTYIALNHDKNLTIGYLGGSITNGYSASANGGNIADSFVNRTTSWFEQNYPGVTIEAVNAGISDTATNFGVYRLQKHLMNTDGHDMPDLVFVEFTVNDWTYDNGISQDSKDISRQIESLVRNVYSINPNADIVFVFTARSENSASRLEYVKIAESYGIPYVDMGVPMQALMTERGAANEGAGTYYYTTDNLHPSGIGYGVYFEQIKALLEKNLINSGVYSTTPKNHEANMPTQINRSLWLYPRIIPAKEFTLSGNTARWSGLNSSMFGTSKTLQSSVSVTEDSFFARGEDARAEFTFTGTSFGLVFGMNTSGFNIDYQIDGHGWKNATVDTELLSFQKYAHTQIFVFEQELAYGEHKVELKFNPTSDGKVNVQIGGAAVSGVENGFGKMVALSIDDGPRAVDSNKIMDVLEKHGAHATFFCVGSSINANTAPTLQRMIADGHEIGNHGNGWSGMSNMTKSELLNDFNTVQKKVYDATGVYPKVFRAPGLSTSEVMYQTIPVPLFGGSLGISDWESAEKVGLESRISAMLSAMVDGRVILIHDVEINAQALDTVLPKYREKGFAVVTISDLIKLRGYAAPPNVNYQYTSFPK